MRPADEVRDQFVRPYYLGMMGCGILRRGARAVSQEDVAAAASRLGWDEVAHLVRDTWRERTMGTWYSLAHLHEPDALPELHRSLRTSAGMLTSPGLITVCLLADRAAAAGPIADYLAEDERNAWGGAGFARAALSLARDAPADGDPGLADRRAARDMLEAAAHLRNLIEQTR